MSNPLWFTLRSGKKSIYPAGLWFLAFLYLLSFAGYADKAGEKGQAQPDRDFKTASNDAADEDIKGWLLGCSGVLWEANFSRFDTLAGQDINEATIHNEKKQLEEWWDIKDRDSFLETLSWLTEGGHRKRFEEDCRKVGLLSDSEFSQALNACPKDLEVLNRLIIARRYCYEQSEKSLIGWDYCRYICLCRRGFLCGYIDEKTAWTNMISAGRKLQQTFGSWEEMGQNYLLGRQYWSFEETEKYVGRFQDAFERLLELPSSPWRRYPWNLDLGRAETILLAREKKADKSVSDGSSAESKTQSCAIPSLALTPVRTVTNHISDYKSAGKVHVVPDQYKTIQAALDAAKPNDTVFIKKGTYREDVLLKSKNNIRIAGEQTDKVFLCSTGQRKEGVLCIYDCNNIVVSDLTVKSDAETKMPALKDGISVSQSVIDILRCRVSGVRGYGIYCRHGARGYIQDCMIEKNVRGGIYLGSAETFVTLSNCRILKNDSSGVLISSRAEGLLEKNICQSNTMAGIHVYNQGTRVTCTENDVSENGSQGIIVEGGAKGRLKANVCCRNKRDGIAVFGDSTFATLEQNTCCENGHYGIKMHNQAAGLIEGCVCRDNQRGGITVFGEGTQATLIRNLCTGNQMNGIHISQCQVDWLEANTANYNKESGMIVDRMEREVLLKGNCSEENWWRGIAVYDSDAQLYENMCRNNIERGMYLSGPKSTFLARQNQLISNSSSGLYVQKVAKAQIENNVCEGNIGAGVEIYGPCGSVHAVENQCIKNYPNGILFEDGVRGYAGKNNCQQSGWAGIAVRGEGTNLVVEENTCRGGLWGIVVWANAQCSWGKDNATEGNTGAGIKIR